jgi:rhodanese-related sulfurtransferase
MVSTADLGERLGDPSLVVVDVRSIAAYNGWRLQGEARGGHVPGAVAFPRTWLSRFADADIARVLREKGVTPNRTIVVYGDGADDAGDLVPRLGRLGYEDVWVYDAGFRAWAADGRLPIERLPNYDKLVHPAWLRRLTEGERPEAYRANDYLLFHVNFGAPEEYEESHLPGALEADRRLRRWLAGMGPGSEQPDRGRLGVGVVAGRGRLADLTGSPRWSAVADCGAAGRQSTRARPQRRRSGPGRRCRQRRELFGTRRPARLPRKTHAWLRARQTLAARSARARCRGLRGFATARIDRSSRPRRGP